MTTDIQARAEQIARARALGDVTWTLNDPTGRTLTLTNGATGKSWTRDAYGHWSPAVRPKRAVARIAALLLTRADGYAEAVAALLRQDIRPWRELLDLGATAVIGAGCRPDWAWAGRDQVAALMHATEQRPHRMVLVIDDADAYAASWYADAATATDAAWAFYLRSQGREAELAGQGETTIDTYDTRGEAALVLVTFRGGGQRPGQSWRVEPVDGDQ
ncbi:hypothetical protein ACIBTV_27480 [Micromonospora sp. NPDC049366]|uniref:hypothetical protein n=1 Tax=Micromonospora sp. NPDC049366 TaxID=3364271 RepID=UPI00379A7E32